MDGRQRSILKFFRAFLTLGKKSLSLSVGVCVPVCAVIMYICRYICTYICIHVLWRLEVSSITLPVLEPVSCWIWSWLTWLDYEQCGFFFLFQPLQCWDYRCLQGASCLIPGFLWNRIRFSFSFSKRLRLRCSLSSCVSFLPSASLFPCIQIWCCEVICAGMTRWHSSSQPHELMCEILTLSLCLIHHWSHF